MHVKTLVYFLLFTGFISCKNILIFNPIFAFSHVKFVTQMADIIADHGHNVTLFQPYHIAMKNTEGLVKNRKVNIINYYPHDFNTISGAMPETFSGLWDSKLLNNAILSAYAMPKAIGRVFEKTATQLLQDESILEELKSRKFEVVISEAFEITEMYLAHLLKIPSIPIKSSVRYPAFNNAFGQPSSLGYLPQQGLSREIGFLDRLLEVYDHYFLVKMQERLNEYQVNFIEKALGHPVPHWRDLVKESPIYITNSNPYLDFAVPTTATVVHVGGITMDMKKLKNPQQLPDEYEEILQERDSTVLISFGSVVRSCDMPENFKAGVVKMFESLPDITFIWKYEKDDVEFQKKLPKNVHLKKWVPQPSLLADKRFVKRFVTHGGLGSTMEVAYTGKPALMVPIFADQFNNANMLARHGGAIPYDKLDLADGEKFTKTVREMVINPKYNDNAKVLLIILLNQPIDPKLNLMKHLEFAMEFPNLRSQIPEINNAGLIGYYYLDIIAFFILFACLALYLFTNLIFKIFRFVPKKTKHD
ncbi:glucuronosyltransferase [Caenorhabditis elegans]|uniref:glucuronosyltransferase n=1 Tax=Caenorhabditis elegans TaxID=6239 RepID=Q9TXZ5_CAEEL|nr:glucuronosyltransferase [Caenorhabditis elegans]CCD62607.1 glucuronosyltransferase [Caenorhabditis elegans]|eukprot:NP_504316.1 UDP-GlucuronosylTransferase [Caenorhabditis elegans]